MTPRKLYYDTLKQASGALGIPVDVLRAAKNAGCPNFKHGRVKRPGLESWIRDHQEQMAKQDSGSLKERLLSQQIRKLVLENDLKEKRSIPRAIAIDAHAKFYGSLMPALEQILCNEYPALCVGLDMPQIRIKGRQVFDKIEEKFREAARFWQGW